MGHRFVTMTDDDQGANLWIAVLLTICFTTLAAATRLLLRRKTFGRDDVALFTAQALAWTSCAAMIVSLVNGLGKTGDSTEITARQRTQAMALRASQILFIVVTSVTRTSILLLVERIFTREFRLCRYMFIVFNTVNVLWGFSAIMTISVKCAPTHIFQSIPAGVCPSDTQRWLVFAIVECVLEAVVAFLPVILLFQVRCIPMRYRVFASLAFLSRLLAIPLLAFLTITYTSWINQYSRAGTRLILPLAFQQICLSWTLLSASIPYMRSFVRTFKKDSTMPYMDTPWPSERRRAGSKSSSSAATRTETGSAGFIRSTTSTMQEVKWVSLPPSPTTTIVACPTPAALSPKQPSRRQSRAWSLYSTKSQARRSMPPSSSSTNVTAGVVAAPQTPPRLTRASSSHTSIFNTDAPGGSRLRPEVFESWTQIYHSHSPPLRQGKDAHRRSTPVMGDQFGIRLDMAFDLRVH